MKKLIYLSLSLLTFSFLLGTPAFATSSESQPNHSAESQKPIGAEAGQKGGIYTVGRAFKTTGQTMETGFKAAGRGIKHGAIVTGHGIKKGGEATGHAFKKAGTSVNDFFTGEKSK